MRSLTFILLLAVCFFGGVTYGTFEKNRFADEVTIEENEVEEIEPVYEVELETIDIMEKEENDHLVNKSANILERVVTSMFEFVIQIMYQFANLFF